MIIGAIADLHFRGKDLAVKSRVWANTLDQMKALGVQKILDAGDTFDDPRVLDSGATTGTVFRGYLDPVERAGIEIIVIDGNHTRKGPKDRGALALLEGHPLFTVVRRPRVITLNCATTNPRDYAHERTVYVACLPWTFQSVFKAKHQDKSPEEVGRLFAQACQAQLQGLRAELDHSCNTNFRRPGPPFKILLGHCEVSGSTNRYRFMLPSSYFSYSKTDLESVGADVICLGHYHMRQGHYLGALTQLNHGEQDNPQGWLLIDTETGERRFVDIEAPRYWTIAPGDPDPPGVQPWDVVKRQRPAVVKTAAIRSTEVEASQDLPTLLLGYARANGEERELPTEELAEVVEAAEYREAATGSLTAVTRLRLEGIGPHTATDVEIGDGWTALVGRNGSGKSLLLESVIATLYGVWPHPDRPSTYDLMTAPEAVMEIEFQAEGRTLKARRELRQTGKSQSTKAWLWEGTTALAGPKVRDFEQAVEQIVGPLNLVLGSIFLAQEARGDLVAADNAQRKEFMRHYLGLDRYDVLSQTAKALADEVDAEVRGDESRLLELPKLEEEAPQLEINLYEIEQTVGALKTSVTHYEAELEKLQRVGNELKEKNLQREQLERDTQQVRRQADLYLREANDLKTRVQVGEEALRSEDQLRQRARELENVPEALEALRAQSEAHFAGKAKRREIEMLIEQRERNLRDEEQGLSRAADDYARQIEALKREQANARNGAEGLKRVGCASNLLECPLIERAKSDRDRIDTLQQQIDELKHQQLALAAKREMLDYGQEHRQAIGQLREQLKAFSEVPPPVDVSETARLGKLNRERENIAQRLAGMAQNRTNLEQTRADLAAKQQQHTEAVNHVHALAAQLMGLPDVGPQLEQLRNEYRTTETDRRNAQELLTKSNQDLGRAQAALEANQKRREELQQLQAQLGKRIARRDNLRWLQQATGKDGLPQLLISSAVPAIEEILREVCETDFEGRFSLRFETVRANKTKGQKEVFDILFTDGKTGREYDARSCSPGEKSSVRAALRTALVLYRAGQAGSGYQAAFLDEPSASQDAEAAETTIRMLDRLGERFQQVLIVSHDPQLLAGIPTQVALPLATADQKELQELA